MVFNSSEFLAFFAIFLALYYLLRGSLRFRNLLVLAGSYVFYGWWDYRFLLLLFLSSVTDYAFGWLLGRSENQRVRKGIVTWSVILNLGVLGFFKYFNFFRDSVLNLLEVFGWRVPGPSLDIILPIGISFYTFQSMSYVIDVYRREVPPARNLVQFLAYVAFFPQLIAGPIERAWHLLPQFGKTLEINRWNIQEGVWLILWGLFKKVVISDNLSHLVSISYDFATPSGPLVILGTIAFAFRIYCDFSGYSDIARGCAKVLGFDLMLNFNLPYFATSVGDFWRRWHISLSTWLRDYLYVPLGGNRQGEHRTYLNLLLTMLLGGLWHGAAANFILWGLWHGAALAVHRLWRERFGQLSGGVGWVLTFLVVLYGWLLFRATSLDHVITLTKALTIFSMPPWWKYYLINLSVLLTPVVAMQVWQHLSGDLLVPLKLRFWPRTLLQGTLLYLVVLFWQEEPAPFIYFQF